MRERERLKTLTEIDGEEGGVGCESGEYEVENEDKSWA